MGQPDIGPLDAKPMRLLCCELERIIRSVMPHAGRDDTLPMLNGICLEKSGNSLIAVATDRFTVGVSWTRGPGLPFNAFLRLDKLPTLLTMLKTTPSKRYDRWVTIKPGKTQVRFEFANDEALILRTSEAEFPKWRQLVPKRVTPGDGTELPTFAQVAVNPEYMARFAQVKSNSPGRHHMEMFQQKRNRAIAVKIGDDFLGLIMPVRMPESKPPKEGGVPPTWEPPAWLK